MGFSQRNRFMSDPFRTPPGTNPPRHVREASSYTPWIGTAIALALVFALGFWATSRPTTTANPPAVTATPAPRVPAPAPEETTGQAAAHAPESTLRIRKSGPPRPGV